jgi:hypothetical protein
MLFVAVNEILRGVRHLPRWKVEIKLKKYGKFFEDMAVPWSVAIWRAMF